MRNVWRERGGRDRQTDRQTETDRQTDREKEREKQTNKQTNKTKTGKRNHAGSSGKKDKT